MTRLATFVLMLCSLGSTPDGGTLSTLLYDRPVVLSGQVEVAEEHLADGREESAYLLRLDAPVNVRSLEVPAGDDTPEREVREVQLAFSEVRKQARVRAASGARITVCGTLFHGFNAHHHRDVVMANTRPCGAGDAGTSG